MLVNPDQITPETMQVLFWFVPTVAMIFILPRIGMLGAFVAKKILKVGQ